jgi:hypothetical protein
VLSAPFPEDDEPGVKVTVSLDGGIPLSDLSFDQMNGLNYLNGSPVDFQESVIKSVTFPVARLYPGEAAMTGLGYGDSDRETQALDSSGPGACPLRQSS